MSWTFVSDIHFTENETSISVGQILSGISVSHTYEGSSPVPHAPLTPYGRRVLYWLFAFTRYISRRIICVVRIVNYMSVGETLRKENSQEMKNGVV